VAGDDEEIKKGGAKCLMDMVEDLEGGDGDLASEEALPPGLSLVEEGGDYLVVVISSAELQECLSHQLIPLMVALGLCLIMEERLIRELCHMVMLEHLWGQIPMLRR
jgi:hypothetical protein